MTTNRAPAMPFPSGWRPLRPAGLLAVGLALLLLSPAAARAAGPDRDGVPYRCDGDPLVAV